MTGHEPAPTPSAKPYTLGVMFVHGIGEQPLGDTLKNIVDPIVRSLDLWIHGVARWRARSVKPEEAQAWADALPANDGPVELTARVREQALEMAWSAEWNTAKLSPSVAQDLKASTFWSGGAVLQDGQLPLAPGAGDCPTHAVLRVHTTDEQYQVNQGSALLAESWWARSFVPPTPMALLSWTFKVLPLAIGTHFGDGVRRQFSQAFEPATGRLRRVGHGALALALLAVMVLAVPLALPLQCLLVGTVILGAVPIQFIRDAMRSVQSVLVGTVGDSFLLVASPVSRAMIVAQCKRDIHWLTERCERVHVVAHSQGCAVSYLALCESLPEEVREVTWIGSGLRKLEILRATERDDNAAASGWYSAGGPFVAWVLASGMASGWSWESTPGRLVVVIGLVAFYFFGMVRLVFMMRAGATAAWLRGWCERKVQFTDIYATHDPVPHGPLFDGTTSDKADVEAHQVHNLMSWASDHTSYWRNVEEVMLPLALRISAALGVPVDKLLASDGSWLARGAKRRRHRVLTLATLRATVLASGAWLLWRSAAAWSALAGAAIDQVWAWGWSGGAFDAAALSLPLRTLLPELALWVALPYAVLALSWRGWDAHEQRAFLLRRCPSNLLETTLVTTMLAAALLPVAHAAAQAWAGVSVSTALTSAVAGSIFAGYFYAFIFQLPRRAFS